MSIELRVAQTMAWARVVETCAYGEGPWTFRTQSGGAPATRLIDEESGQIVFSGLVHVTASPIELWCGENLVTLISVPTLGLRYVSWALSLDDHSRAR